MRGFQPTGARRAKNYADGGLVSGIKMALGLDPERAARMAAYRAEQAKSQQAAPPPTPEPASDQKAISGYAAGSALKRREAAAGLKDGGMVRGPGTGTSDDVKATVPQGSYIMPADTTKTLGAEALGKMGKPVPVNLSNGEYQMPPEQVHAVGVETLNQIKDATHAPAARGFPTGVQTKQTAEPRMFFASGGVVDEEPPLPRGIVYAPNYGPAGHNPQARIDAQAGSAAPAALPDWSAQGQMSYGDQMRNVGSAILNAPATALKHIVSAPGHGFDSGNQPTPSASLGAGAGRGVVNPAVVSSPAPVAPVAPTAPGALLRLDSQTDPRSSTYAGSTPAPTDVSARPVTAATPKPAEIMPGVYQHGRGQFSDNPTGMGFAPGAGNPSANNIAAADALAARSAAGVSGMVARGMPSQQVPQVDAPTVMHSGNSWQARNDLRSAAISASSMTNARDRNPRTGMSPAEVQLAALAGADAKARELDASMPGYALKANAELQRTGMQEQGATGRNTQDSAVRMADVQARGFDAAARRGVDERRLGLDERKFGADERVKNVEIQGAEQMQKLRNTLLDPKATPEQRKQAEASLLAIQGKQAGGNWKLHVTPNTKDMNGNTTEGSIYRINDLTGETQRVDGQPSTSPYQEGQTLKGKDGKTYVVKNGQPALKG